MPNKCFDFFLTWLPFSCFLLIKTRHRSEKLSLSTVHLNMFRTHFVSWRRVSHRGIYLQWRRENCGNAVWSKDLGQIFTVSGVFVWTILTFAPAFFVYSSNNVDVCRATLSTSACTSCGVLRSPRILCKIPFTNVCYFIYTGLVWWPCEGGNEQRSTDSGITSPSSRICSNPEAATA